MLITGSHIKTDGSVRQWDCVECIGEWYSKKQKSTMFKVLENGEERNITERTFSGQVLTESNILHYENGERIRVEWYRSPYIGQECTACHIELTEDNALCTVQMCKDHTCDHCGDPITDDNAGWTYMYCNKMECKRKADMFW